MNSHDQNTLPESEPSHVTNKYFKGFSYPLEKKINEIALSTIRSIQVLKSSNSFLLQIPLHILNDNINNKCSNTDDVTSLLLDT